MGLTRGLDPTQTWSHTASKCGLQPPSLPAPPKPPPSPPGPNPYLSLDPHPHAPHQVCKGAIEVSELSKRPRELEEESEADARAKRRLGERQAAERSAAVEWAQVRTRGAC